MAGPLSHIRVLDASRVLAGPWAGQILADLGADVIKIERPGSGDDTRAWGPPFLMDENGNETREAGYYLAANRGKRSITVSLDTPEGQDIVRRLVAESDVFLENFMVGTLDRYGLGYAALSAVNPRLIYCSITGFGQNGPRSSQPAYDFLIQAMGGLMSVTGERDNIPGGGPQKVGIPIVDLITGVYASVAIAAAIAGRAETGRGDYIDIGMLDVQVGLLANQAMNFLLAGRTPGRTGNAHPNIQPQQVFDASDGQFVLVVGNDVQFAKLCNVIGLSELAGDERFRTNPARVRHRDELTPIVEQAFRSRPRSAWIDELNAVGVPAGPINTIPEVFNDPQVQHRELLRYLQHPEAGVVPQVLSPFRFTNSPPSFEVAPPLLGQHTQEILSEMGYASNEIEHLRIAGVI